MLNPRLDQIQTLITQGRLADAKTMLQQAVQRSPRDVALLIALVGVLLRLDEVDAALYQADRLLQGLASANQQQSSGVVDQLAAMSMGLLGAGQVKAGRELLTLIVKRCPRHLRARLDLAQYWFRVNNHAEALRLCREGLVLHPGHPDLSIGLVCLMPMGRCDEYIRESGPALAASPDNIALASSVAAAHLYSPTVTRDQTMAAHRRYASALEASVAAPDRAQVPFENTRDPERPLRVAILSADIRRTACFYFTKPLLRDYDRSKLTMLLYQCNGQEDDHTRELHEIAQAGNSEPTSRRLDPTNSPIAIRAGLAQLRADRIDIIIDAMGLTNGNAMPLICRRGAPLQMTWMGYPSTTALREMDYRITDALTDPPGTDDQFTERLLRLPDAHACCWTPARDAQPVDPVPPCLRPTTQGNLQAEGPEGTGEGVPRVGVTFGSFTSIVKLNDAVLRAWTRIVLAVPGSRLLIKNWLLDHPPGREALAERFVAAGMPQDRLVLESQQTDGSCVMNHYQRLDICLDSWPYNSHTSTNEALYMGVPVVTRRWNSPPGRVGAALLTHVGLADLVADDDDQYVRIAVELAASTERLRELRANLRDRFAACPVMNGQRTALALETALRGAWREWCGGD